MNCSSCQYLDKVKIEAYISRNHCSYPDVAYKVCKIAHTVNPTHCTYIKSAQDVENMNICFNCKYWVGGGDYGLSCNKDYYVASSNGFRDCCDKFERR